MPSASAPVVLSIQIGVARDHGDLTAGESPQGLWRTAFWKTPVAGPVRIQRLGLEGDEQADLRVHGGVDKAVLAYAADHYDDWRNQLDLIEIGPGGFGENLTISCLDETEVCIGDRWRIGAARLEVSQPRRPCWKLARRWDRPDLPRQVVRTGRTGWYLRVLEPGMVQAGDFCERETRPHADWTIARATRALFDRRFPADEARELADIPQLSNAWRENLLARLSMRLD